MYVKKMLPRIIHPPGWLLLGSERMNGEVDAAYAYVVLFGAIPATGRVAVTCPLICLEDYLRQSLGYSRS